MTRSDPQAAQAANKSAQRGSHLQPMPRVSLEAALAHHKSKDAFVMPTKKKIEQEAHLPPKPQLQPSLCYKSCVALTTTDLHYTLYPPCRLLTNIVAFLCAISTMRSSYILLTELLRDDSDDDYDPNDDTGDKPGRPLLQCRRSLRSLEPNPGSYTHHSLYVYHGPCSQQALHIYHGPCTQQALRTQHAPCTQHAPTELSV